MKFNRSRYFALVTLLIVNATFALTPEQLRVRKAERLLSIYSQAVEAPGIDGETVREAIDDKKEVINNQEKKIDASYLKVREIVAPLFKSDNTRAITVRLMNQIITSQSNELKEAILKNKKESLVINELVIGTGPEGSAYLQSRTSANPNDAVVVIDNRSKPGGTFSGVGDAFALNSTNRKYDGQRAQPGKGDLNYVTDIVGLPDYKGKRWAEGGSLSEVSSAATYLSSARTMVQTTMTKIRYNENNKIDAKFEVDLKDGVTGKEFKIYTDRVEFITGISEPKEFLDPESQKIIEQEKKSAQRANRAPKIEQFTNFIERIGNPDNRTPLRDLVGKEVLLVGRGDSGRVVAEFLTGLGPEGSYKSDVAQVGRPKRIFWFVGFEGERRCKEYIDQSRARYSQIAQAINSGVLVPVPGRVTKINKEANGQYSVAHEFKKEDGKVVKKRSNIEFILPKDDRQGRKKETTKNERVLFDKAILTTGFKNGLPDIIEPLTEGKDFKDVWNTREGKVKAFDNKSIAYARELKVAPEVGLSGPANEFLGGLPKKAELAGVNANTVSLFANVERVKFNAVQNAKKSRGAKISNIETFAPLETKSAVEIEVNRRSNTTLDLKAQASEGVNRASNVDLALRAALDFSFRKLKFKGIDGMVEFSIVKGKAGNYKINFRDVNLNASQKESLTKSIGANELLSDILARELFSKESKIKQIDVEIPLRESGTLRLQEMVTTKRRVGR